VFEGVQKKLSRLSAEESAKYRLDDCLGGTSPSIHLRAIRRIYGDKAGDIIEGLKKNPAAAIPVVLKRLKSKEEEWRDAQKGFNKVWREQNEKFYLKSLDHQGMNFKQNDMKYLRSKSLLNEIEALYDERHENAAGDENGGGAAAATAAPTTGPHLVLPYKDKSVLDDAANLLIHHVKRQTGIHKEDKQKIKSLIRQFIPDLFYHPRQELSDDEREELEEKSARKSDEGVEEEEVEKRDDDVATSSTSPTLEVDSGGGCGSNSNNADSSVALEVNVEDIKVPLYAISCHPDEQYTLFFADNHWYLFLRLHQILCDRLSKMYERANIIAKQEMGSKDGPKESAAVSLRLKPKPEIEIEEYYPAMLDMVKNVLDGNMDSTTYEDTLREMFGIHAYIAFTLDKVVSHAVRQLQYLVTDEYCQDCYDLFAKEKVKSATGGACATAYQRVNAEANYQKKAEALNMESCFKIFIYKLDCKITIECLDTDGENNEDTQENEKWNSFHQEAESNNEPANNNKDKFSEFNESNDKMDTS
jgi:paired amphipathic helix protein Sin3a